MKQSIVDVQVKTTWLSRLLLSMAKAMKRWSVFAAWKLTEWSIFYGALWRLENGKWNRFDRRIRSLHYGTLWRIGDAGYCCFAYQRDLEFGGK